MPPPALPSQRPRNTAAGSNSSRRRHANIPKRVTYRTAMVSSDADIERLGENPYRLGLLSEMCPHCGALYFTREKKNREGVR